MTPPTALVDTLEKDGVFVHSLGMKPGVPDLRAVNSLNGLINEIKPNVVHSHMVHANILSRVTKRKSKDFSMPLVCTAHNTVEGGKWVDLAYRWTDKHCELTTNVSQAAVDRYIEIGAVPADRIRLMRNGLETKNYEQSELTRVAKRAELDCQDVFVWLAVGRLSEQKNYPLMLNAFADHMKVHQKAHLVLVGTGEKEGELKELVDSLNLGSHISWLGSRDDVPELMAASDAYLMSSSWEGLPMVLLEASASSLPVVATDVGGNAEIIQNQKSGFIVSSESRVELVSAMSKLVALPENERRELGEEGRAFVKINYELNSIVDQWETIYESLQIES